MLKVINKKKGQNTAEYAILIALVVGAIIAMQTFAQRGLNARMRGASLHMRDEMGDALRQVREEDDAVIERDFDLGESGQYEPYYQNSADYSDTDSQSNVVASPTLIGKEESINRVRRADDNDDGETFGYDRTEYNGDVGATEQD